MTIEIVLTILGILSILWLVWGAFKHNRGAYACLVSLGARMFVALLFILAMSKLAEGKKSLKENGDNAAAVKAALVAFAIFGFIFAKLIKPMIGTRIVSYPRPQNAVQLLLALKGNCLDGTGSSLPNVATSRSREVAGGARLSRPRIYRYWARLCVGLFAIFIWNPLIRAWRFLTEFAS